MKNIRKWLNRILNPRARLKRLEAEDAADALPPPPSLRWKQVLSYPPLVVGILIVTGLIVVLWFAPQFSSYDPYLITQSLRPYYDATAKKLISPPFPPSSDFPLGTDQWGNDLLSLVLYGARVTLIVGVYITLTRILIGTVLGLVAGWNEDSIADKTINGIGSIMGSVPVLLSSIILIYSLNIYNGLWVFVVALSALGWFETARLVRGEVQVIKHASYVEAARAIGLNDFQIVVRHVLPNVTAYLIVIAVLETGAVLLLLAELAFLGVFIGGGTRYNDDPFSPKIVLLREVPEWGAMVAQGVRYIRSHPNMVLVPGFAFFISIVGVNALGEGLRWLFTRWPFSMAVLLKKRTAVVAILLVFVSLIILNQTGPEASFARVSREITAENVQARVDLLMQMQAKNPDDADEVIADYIANQMEEMGVAPGYRSGLHATYRYEYGTMTVPLLSTPTLASASSNGSPSQTFAYQADFVLAPDQPMDNVSIMAPVLLVNPQIENSSWSFDGRIVMTMESMAPVDYSQFVASHGAVGLLLIDDNSVLPCKLPQASMPLTITSYEKRIINEFISRDVLVKSDPLPLPTLIISPETAEQLMAADQAGLNIFSRTDWTQLDLSTQARVRLEFGSGEQVMVNGVMGFKGGYDIDKAHETLILYAPYDSRTDSPGDMYSLAVMLEMLQAWNNNRLDPRRSIIFIAWDGSSLGSPGAQSFMDMPQNFGLLTPPVPAGEVEPVMVWDLSMTGALNGDLIFSPGSDNKLKNLTKQSTGKFGIDTISVKDADCQPEPVVLLPSLSIMPAPSGSPSPEFVESFGRSISLAVLKILRLPNY